MEQKAQFVKYKNVKPIERQSSFYLMIENFDALGNCNTPIVSKKIQFLDVDAVWWVSIVSINKIFVKPFLELIFYIQTNESICSSKIWSYVVTGYINGTHKTCFNAQRIYKKESSYEQKFSLDVLKGKSFLELKLEMTLTAQPEPNVIPLQKCMDTTVQCKKIISNNKCILNDSKYSDFNFIVQGKKFKVHKNILAAASPIFDKLFSAKFKETHSNECHVTDVEPAIFRYLLNFIYSGELPENLQDENIPRKLFCAAHYYQIDELVDICIQVEHYKLSLDNAVDMYEWAVTYKLDALKMDAWKIIKFDILEISDEMNPPSTRSILSLIANKNAKDKCLEEYRLKLGKLQTSMNVSFK